MKRQLTFDYENGQYALKENDEIIFSIDGKELKFISLDFYNGVYKDKSAAIELKNVMGNDELKKGSYIFSWLSEIVTAIQDEINDPISEDTSEEERIDKSPTKIIPLFEMAACAGNGFYSEGEIAIENNIKTTYLDADYAVKISGDSMEPTIKDGSTVCVKCTEELHDGDIGIFIVNGDVMCKRYKEDNAEKWLVPDNTSSNYKAIQLDENIECRVQGKVLL